MGKLPWAVSLLGHAGALAGLALVAASRAPFALPRVSLMVHHEQALDAEPEYEEEVQLPESVAEPLETPERDCPDPPPIEAPPVDCVVQVEWPTPVGRGLTMRLRKPLRDPRRKKAAAAPQPARVNSPIRAKRALPAGPTRAAQAIRGGSGIVYPREARRRGIEGIAILRLNISATGQVTAVKLLTSSGHPILDTAAQRAAWNWRFRPALVRGHPQKTTLTRQVRFRLR